MIFRKIYNNLKPFLIYDISVIGSWAVFYITAQIQVFHKYENAAILDAMGFTLFYLIFTVLFIKLGYSERIKAIRIGMILFEIKLLAYSVWYMLYMISSDELPSALSVLTLGNIIYGDFKPITRLISDVNYNALVCIPDLLLSLIWPVLSFCIGYLIQKKTSDSSEV